MVDLRQKDLSDWQKENFGKVSSEDCALGMAEEVGELCHLVLKRKQHIRESANGDEVRELIADAFSDTVIYGIQLMTIELIDAEYVLEYTINKILKRDWKSNPQTGEKL